MPTAAMALVPSLDTNAISTTAKIAYIAISSIRKYYLDLRVIRLDQFKSSIARGIASREKEA